MSDKKLATCGTCPYAHEAKTHAFQQPGLVIVGQAKLECRGAPVQLRIIRGAFVSLYTPVTDDTPACVMHPEYVPARPLSVEPMACEQGSHEQVMTPGERALILDKWGDAGGTQKPV